MQTKQISVFLENKVGRLAEVARILARDGVNIRALSLADTSDFGVLRLLVSDADKARHALKDNGFTVRVSDVTAVPVKDEPGGLLRVLDILLAASINIEYMYAYANPKGGKAVMIFRFEPEERAVSVLAENGITVLGAEDLSAMEEAGA
ncbi:MAG: ACT domain-containing protein [Thermodesulfobacteriota bacterium]